MVKVPDCDSGNTGSSPVIRQPCEQNSTIGITHPCSGAIREKLHYSATTPRWGSHFSQPALLRKGFPGGCGSQLHLPREWINGKSSAFQAENMGSIPISRCNLLPKSPLHSPPLCWRRWGPFRGGSNQQNKPLMAPIPAFLPHVHDGLELSLLFFLVFSSILPYLVLLLYLNSPGREKTFPKSGVIIYRFYIGFAICTLLVTLLSLAHLPHYFLCGGFSGWFSSFSFFIWFPCGAGIHTAMWLSRER